MGRRGPGCKRLPRQQRGAYPKEGVGCNPEKLALMKLPVRRLCLRTADVVWQSGWPAWYSVQRRRDAEGKHV